MTRYTVSGTLAVLPFCIAASFAQPASAQVDTTPLPNLHPNAHVVIGERSNYGGGVYTKQHVFPLAPSATSKVNGPAMYLAGAMTGSNRDFRGWGAAEGELYDVYLSDENGAPQENGYCTTIDVVWRGYPVGGAIHKGGHLFNVHIQDGDPTTAASTSEIARFDEVTNSSLGIDGEAWRNPKAYEPGSGHYSTVTVLGRMPVGSTDPMSITLCRSQVSEWVGNQRGMTFGLQAQQAPGTGTLHVGCPGVDGYNCQPQLGDKPCGLSLPMACFRPGGPPHPAGVLVSQKTPPLLTPPPPNEAVEGEHVTLEITA